MSARTHVRMADAGLHLLAGGARPPPISTGYIYPTRIYDRMRSINANAQRLDANMRAFVTNQALRLGWDDGLGGGWYPAWKPFYEKYAGPNASDWAKLGAAFDTEALSAEVDRRERELDAIVVDYNSQHRADGSSVPQIAPLTVAPLADENFIPWWFWVIGGVALAGAGWFIYRKVQEGKAKQRMVEERVLPAFFGAEGAKAATEYHEAGRDAIYEPFSLSHFARDPAPPMHVHVHTSGHSPRATHHQGFVGHDPEPRVSHLPLHFRQDKSPFRFSHDEDEYDIPGLDYDYDDE